MSHGAPAHHFRTKAALLTAFATQGYERLGAAVLESIASLRPETGDALLDAVGRGYVRFVLADRQRFEVMFLLDLLDLLDVDDPAFVAAGEAAYAMLLAAVEQCAGEGRLGHADPELVAVASWSLVHGLGAPWLSGRLTERIAETDPDRLAEAVCRLFVPRVLVAPGERPG